MTNKTTSDVVKQGNTLGQTIAFQTVACDSVRRPQQQPRMLLAAASMSIPCAPTTTSDVH